MPKYRVYWMEYHHDDVEAPDSVEAMEKTVDDRKGQPTLDGFAQGYTAELRKEEG